MPRKKSSNIELTPHFHHSIKFKERAFKFTVRQKKFLATLLDPSVKVFFVSGPAGSSKTYMSLYGCLRLLAENPEKELLYVRSIAESADKGLGSLPGDITDKFDPFLMPLYDKLDEIIFEGDTAFLKQEGRISAVPINFLRGANWNEKLIVADEAQNFTFKELTTLITRIGEDSKLIICGDFMQSDINGKTGFAEMFDLFADDDSVGNGIHCFNFNKSDIVRSKILKFIISKLESYKKV